MRSIVSVIVPPPDPPVLVTLAQVKSELNITDNSQDATLISWIAQASASISAFCQQVLVAETVLEKFRHSLNFINRGHGWFYHGHCHGVAAEALILRSSLVTSILSVMIDGALIPSDQYEFDDCLYRLNSSGYPTAWTFSKSVEIEYVAGFTAGENVPYDLQRAVFLVIRGIQGDASREDPNLKSRETFGVSKLEWWISDKSSSTPLPLEVIGLLTKYIRNWAWME